VTDQRVVPMLSFEDVGRAADWIVEAFGFEEVERYEDERTVTHVTLRLGDGIVFLGNPGPEYRGPKKLAEMCEAARRMLETTRGSSTNWLRSSVAAAGVSGESSPAGLCTA
jgi:uncharacterized glyoxalase superfamily protein PhnB